MVMSKDICPATRYIEHHWFNPINKEYNNICITEEIPQDWDISKEPYYPINNNKNSELYNKYLELLKSKYPNIILGGRLGKYKYYDMDDTIYEAMNYCSSL
jgi:UDP-galactopyranose mutase